MQIVIFITCANKKQASLIASRLIKDRAAACVNIIGNIKSVFWWENKIERSNEALLIVKSNKSRLPKIIKLVRSLHSYQVPEIIALPVIGGYKPYLDWINDSIR
jgi:periplasmic divalent cation tolerance protein